MLGRISDWKWVLIAWQEWLHTFFLTILCQIEFPATRWNPRMFMIYQLRDKSATTEIPKKTKSDSSHQMMFQWEPSQVRPWWGLVLRIHRVLLAPVDRTPVLSVSKWMKKKTSQLILGRWRRTRKKMTLILRLLITTTKTSKLLTLLWNRSVVLDRAKEDANLQRSSPSKVEVEPEGNTVSSWHSALPPELQIAKEMFSGIPAWTEGIFSNRWNTCRQGMLVGFVITL